MKQRMSRRNWLSTGAAVSAGAIVSSLNPMCRADETLSAGAELTLTPNATTGPFYPVPDIESKEFIDADLTKKGDSDKTALGDIVIVSGVVVGLDDQPLSRSLVEVWQTDFNGRYDHPGDRNNAPVDDDFQHWARMRTDELGRFAFRTIKPGKYPGRTPHIHFLIDSGETQIATQMYFEEHMDLNRKDGLYRRMSKDEQEITTVSFDQKSNIDVPVGEFKVVLGESRSRTTTPEQK